MKNSIHFQKIAIIFLLISINSSSWASTVCDTITLVTGKEIIAEIIEKTPDQVTLDFCTEEKRVILKTNQIAYIKKQGTPSKTKEPKTKSTTKKKARKKDHKKQNTFEISTNPVVALFEIFPISIQVPLSEDFEVGADLILTPLNDTRIIYAKAAYYFNPKRGTDKFHIGTFVGIQDKYTGLGFFWGYKIMSNKGVFINLGLGVGRGFYSQKESNSMFESFESGSSTIGYAQLHTGYRFGQKNTKTRN